MQLFLISPLILLPMVRHQKLMAYIILPILSLISVGYTAAIIYYWKIEMWVLQ